MKKFLSLALILTLAFALAVPAMAAAPEMTATFVRDSQGNMWTLTIFEDDEVIYTERYSQSNFNNNTILTVTLEDGRTFNYSVSGGGLIIPEDPPCEHDFVRVVVGAEVSVTIQNVPGNTNPYSFTIAEDCEYICCICGEQDGDTITEYSYFVVSLHNNYAGLVELGDYTVFINSKGNIQVRELYIID